MNSHKFRLLSVSSIVLTSFLLSSSIQASTRLTDEKNDMVPYPSQNKAINDESLAVVENKISGILVTFDNIDKNVEESLKKQTFSLGQSFIEKVETEKDKKANLVKETEDGIKQRTDNLRSVKGRITQQTGYISQEITNIASFLDDRTGTETSRALKSLLRTEISRTINGFTNTLGLPSTYRNLDRYRDYCLIKTSDLESINENIVQYVKDTRDLYIRLDNVWKKAEIIHQKIISARGPLYSSSDSVHTILKKEGGSWYLNLASKANDVDNFIISARDEASNIISDSHSIKSTINNLESNISKLKTTILEKKESHDIIEGYGDSLVQRVLDKSRTEESNLNTNVISNIDTSLDVYFVTGGQYSDKMDSLKRNTDKIGGHVRNIDVFSAEIDTYATQIDDFTKNQTQKVGLHHDSLVNKGKEFDQNAQAIIEKNREVSLGVMKGKTSEIIMAAKALSVMLSDKHDQVQSFKQQLGDRDKYFEGRENVLIGEHDKHVDDVKSSQKELLKEKDKMSSYKEKNLEKMETKNNQLELEIRQYQEKITALNLQISKMSNDSQSVDASLKSMLMMMGVNMSELNDCNTPKLAQKCFSKYLEVKKF